MILSESIKPVQLKTYTGLVDFYRDQYGRTIARSWPKARTTMSPGMRHTSERITTMHSILRATDPAYLESWNIPGMPQGRTKTDFARQSILWQLQNIPQCYCPTITAIGHAYSEWEDVHGIYFKCNPEYQWNHCPWQWYISTTIGPTFTPPTFYLTNQLFRRGDPSSRRPLLSNPTAFRFRPEDESAYPAWHLLPFGAPEHVNLTGYLQAYWTGYMPPPPRTSSTSCYAPAPNPLALSGIYPFGGNETGQFPWT